MSNPDRLTKKEAMDNIILPALRRGGYQVQERVNIGPRLGSWRTSDEPTEANQTAPQRDMTKEEMIKRVILPALQDGGYQCQRRVNIGPKLGGKPVVDMLLTSAVGRRLLFSLNWQRAGETAEQTVPFRAICLAEAMLMNPGEYHQAFLVLAGAGRTPADSRVVQSLPKHLRHGHLVTITGWENFVALGNQRLL